MKTRHHFFAILAITIAFVSCKRPDTLGPELAFASSNFQVISPLKAKLKNPSFVREKNHFTAKFNEKVTWKLTLRGLTSHAFKNYDGVSDFLDSTMTFWDGSTNGKASEVNLFFRGEKVVAYLEILGYEKTLTDTISIVSIKRPTDQFVVLSDYEKASSKTGIWNDVELFDRTYYNDKQIEFGIVPFKYFFSELRDKTDSYIQYRDSILDAPQGTKYLVIKASDGSKDYYITNYGYNAEDIPMFEDSPNNRKNRCVMPNPDSLFLNFFLWGNGPSNTAKLGISFSEQKDPATGYEDRFVIDIEPNHTGWKFYSIRYSDALVTVPDYAKTSIPTGYTPIKESVKITSVGFNIQVKGMGQNFDLKIDYPIFTYGKPLLDVNQ